jgi:hypothetical protein
MSCEGYRDKLIAGLASGETALDGEVVLHLRGCAECKRFYEAQVNFFGTIDSGVRAMVNETVPASLLPGVRARIGEAGALRPMWGFSLTPIGVALAAAILLVVFLVRPKNAPVRVAVVPKIESSAPKIEESWPAHEITTPVKGVRRASVEKPRIVRNKKTARTKMPSEPLQIVIGREEAHGLMMLARNISRNPELGQALLRPAAVMEDRLAAPQALEIEDLEVRPLTEQN